MTLSALLNKFNIKLPPLPTTPPVHEADRTTLLQLAAIIGLAVTTHFGIANPVVAVCALTVYVFKVVIVWHRKTAPPRFVMMLLTISSLVLILFFYGGWNGQTAGISFLVLLVSLKFLESRTLRDYYVVCLLLYFLAASTFLFDSSMYSIASVVLYTIAITAVLFKISNPTPVDTLDSIKASASIILKALPLALLLFFFFPRVYGSFGFIPSLDEGRSKALDDALVAGEMAASAFNTSLAFRVEFDGPMPGNENLYWRSKVMPVESNFTWEVIPPSPQDIAGAVAKRSAANMDSGEFTYRILHEQSADIFIPFLDYVSGYSTGKILDDYSVYIKRKPKVLSYQGTSTLNPSLPKTDATQKPELTTTTSNPTAKLQALLTQFRRNAKNDEELVRAVYQYFSVNQFRYSLTPPGLDEFNPLEDFLFNSKTGYCEHYASAFTTLMRWLGVPARVVVGFQGGTLNNTGNYLEVRYSDAHAWSEVWVNGQWNRVDPTATVSPERIEFGMEALLELWDGEYLNSAGGRALSDYLNPTGYARYARKMRETWKNIGYQWNKWIVNYDQEAQQELLDILGFKHHSSTYTLIGIMALSAGALMLYYFWQLIPRATRRSELQRAYLDFVAKFKKHDIVKDLADTPSDFAAKASHKFPNAATEIDKITKAYQQLRYGRGSDSQQRMQQGSWKNSPRSKDVSLFKQQVKRFKLTF